MVEKQAGARPQKQKRRDVTEQIWDEFFRDFERAEMEKSRERAKRRTVKRAPASRKQ